MQMISLPIAAPHARLQDAWRNSELPHFSGIVLGDGRLVVMQESVVVHDGLREHYASPVCESRIESFDAFGGESVDITALVPPLPISDGLSAVCGEGAMGNEGFVAVTWNGLLMWSAFFVTSNPFYRITMDGEDTLVATSTHEAAWRFRLAAPWNIDVRSAHSTG
jgi:hypothetical protein